MSKVIDSTNLGHLWDLIKQYADGAVAAIASKLVPSGGTTGQVLAKASGTDWDLAWVNQSGGGGTSPSPYGSAPKMDGTASAGTSDDYARGDHVHPHDSSKQDTLSVTSGTLSKGSAASSYTGQVRKYGHVVQLNLNQIKLAAALSSGSTSGTVTTIPSGYRPANQILVPWTSTGAAYGYATIATGGTVTMRNCGSASLTTSATSTIACTYIVS